MDFTKNTTHWKTRNYERFFSFVIFTLRPSFSNSKKDSATATHHRSSPNPTVVMLHTLQIREGSLALLHLLHIGQALQMHQLRFRIVQERVAKQRQLAQRRKLYSSLSLAASNPATPACSCPGRTYSECPNTRQLRTAPPSAAACLLLSATLIPHL